jgi:hypothetical protein
VISVFTVLQSGALPRNNRRLGGNQGPDIVGTDPEKGNPQQVEVAVSILAAWLRSGAAEIEIGETEVFAEQSER